MAAPLGNHNALGNKGGKKDISGRKSAFQEHADATFLWKVFNDKLSKKKLTKLLQDRHSIKDAWIVKMFSGNERFIQQLVQKLFPDNLKMQGEFKNYVITRGGAVSSASETTKDSGVSEQV